MEHSIMLMAINMLVNGKIMSDMDKELIRILLEEYMLKSMKWGKNSSKKKFKKKKFNSL